MATKKPDFETALKELENIVRKIENGECSLEESIELYEKGMKLSANCSNALQNAEQKIITLTQAEELNRE